MVPWLGGNPGVAGSNARDAATGTTPPWFYDVPPVFVRLARTGGWAGALWRVLAKAAPRPPRTAARHYPIQGAVAPYLTSGSLQRPAMKSPIDTEALEAYLLFAVAAACLCWFSYRSTVAHAGHGAPVAAYASPSPPPPPTE